MKRTTLLTIFFFLTLLHMRAQQVTPAFTVYPEFKAATVWLSDGKKLKVMLANIFLKNSTLLYKSGMQTMQANMQTMQRVDFDDRTYYRLDTILAYRVDTVGSDALYCAEHIDFAAWRQAMANNTLFTSLDLNDMVGYTTAELANEQDIHFPVVNSYYFLLNGKYVIAHERQLKRVLNKEKRRLMEAAMAEKDFSWSSEMSLMKLLRMIQ